MRLSDERQRRAHIHTHTHTRTIIARLDDTSLHHPYPSTQVRKSGWCTGGVNSVSTGGGGGGCWYRSPFGMRSAAVAGLCRLSTNRVVLSVLCPYKVMPQDGRKVAVDWANPSSANGVRNHDRPVPSAVRPPSTDRYRYRPQTPGTMDSPGRMHTGPGPLSHFTENHRNRCCATPWGFQSAPSSTNGRHFQVNMILLIFFFFHSPNGYSTILFSVPCSSFGYFYRWEILKKLRPKNTHPTSFTRSSKTSFPRVYFTRSRSPISR